MAKGFSSSASTMPSVLFAAWRQRHMSGCSCTGPHHCTLASEVLSRHCWDCERLVARHGDDWWLLAGLIVVLLFRGTGQVVQVCAASSFGLEYSAAERTRVDTINLSDSGLFR